jgi:phosphate uptake regulator
MVRSVEGMLLPPSEEYLPIYIPAEILEFLRGAEYICGYVVYSYMYTRRVQKTGGSTYIVSLPSAWAGKNGIDRGSEVSIKEDEDRLILSLGKKKKEIVKKVLISGSVDSEMFLRGLISIYISQFDTLVIESSRYLTNELREQAKKFARLVMGVETFEESSNRIILQNVLDSESFPVDKAIRRMSTNVELMLEDTVKGIESSDLDLLESVIARDDEVDRYHLYIFRETNRKGSAQGPILLFILSRILERVADHAVNAAKTWKDRGAGVDPTELIKFFNDARKIFADAVKVLHAPQFGEINEIISRKSAIIDEKSRLITEAKRGELVAVTSVVEDISRISLYSTDIAELAMDRVAFANSEISIS